MILNLLALISFTCMCFAQQNSSVHPITINGKHFVDAVNNSRFYLRGIDYQPGGSAAYDRGSDPLSDVQRCARDVFLMQELGINTVRVYTVNPQLNHDDCMTMLAAANIYLVLDVNSPLAGESINRYEPWTTYTPEYLRHVFEVVDQFSRYNNTLGFFIGNEVINDERSASVSPVYIRAVARDVKDYMYYNCPRTVPIGYSAADDLLYRTELPHYLTCGDDNSAVDFYGVNSYQWCGEQTIETSGYDALIKDHEDFDFPIFLSEFGCNHVQPRIFQEVEAIFSPRMTPVFDGGLVYEFSQESNDYGLVLIDDDGNAHLRKDFIALQQQFRKVAEIESTNEASTISSSTMSSSNSSTSLFTAANEPVQESSFSSAPTSRRTSLRVARPNRKSACLPSYANLPGAGKAIPNSFGTDMIRNGVHVSRGKYKASILESMPASSFTVYDLNDRPLPDVRVKVLNHFDADARYHWRTRTGVPTSQEQELQIEKMKKAKKQTRNRAERQWSFISLIDNALLFFFQILWYL